MDDRDKLKEKIAQAIYKTTNSFSDGYIPTPYETASEADCLEMAEAALAVMEEYLCQANTGVKGEISSREGALQSTSSAEAMKYLGDVLECFANLDDGDRCTAFEDAMQLYNDHNPDAAIQGEPGFTQRICLTSPLGSGCRRLIEDPSGDTVWNEAVNACADAIKEVEAELAAEGEVYILVKTVEALRSLKREALRQIEEPSGDTVTAASSEASLTQIEKDSSNG